MISTRSKWVPWISANPTGICPRCDRLRRPGWIAGLALASWASACDPCHDWSDLDVVVIGIEDTAQNRSSFEEGLDRFITWTGRPETCVSRAEIRDDLGDGFSGYYRHYRRLVRVEATAPPHTTVHEFCHALDHEEGWVSETRPDLLSPYTSGLDPDNYPTDDHRIHEAFARICDDGPALPSLLDELYEVCGIEDSLEAVHFVADIAFHGEPVTDSTLDGYAATTHVTLISSSSTIAGSERDGLPAGAVAAVGAAGLFVLDDTIVTDDQGTVSVEPLLLLVDPASASVVDSLALDPHAVGEISDNLAYGAHTLFGSTTAPILYQLWGEDRGMAWRVQTDPLRVEALGQLPFDEDTIPVGFERDGLLLVRPSAHGPVLLLDLEDGSSVEVGADDEEGLQTDEATALYVDADGALATYDTSAGLALAGIDWNGELTWTTDLMVATSRVRSLFRTPDDDVALTPVFYTGGVPGGSASPSLSLLYDPATGSWSTPESGCDGLDGEGWMAYGGANWRVSQPVSLDAGYDLQLVQLGIDRD